MALTAIPIFIVLTTLLAITAAGLVVAAWLRPTRKVAGTIDLSARNLGRQHRPTIDRNARRNLYRCVRRRNI